MTESYDVSQPKQSPSIVPTVLLTGVGAGGGCLINKYAGSKKTHEDLIKEMNDKDAFNKNIADDAPNKDLWKELEKKNNAVNDAKKALEEASKGEADKTVQDALNTAQKNIDEWVAKENARLASNAPAAEAPKVTGFPEQLPELSKNNNTNTMKRKYEKLSKSYEAAKAKAGRKYNSEKTKITELQDAARNSFKMPASQTPQTIDELMADLDKEVVKTEIRQVVDPATNVKTFETVETDLYQEIKKKIMSANPPTFSKNVSNLTEEEAMNLPNGEFRKIKPSETVPQGFTKVTNTKGECFIYKTDAASEYLRTMNTNYKKNIENMADEVLNATKEYRIAKF
ncbi:MAG: hypothetical protein MJ237_03295, partial [bacterium]|nr:hypothetical protein [bacterium]